MEDEILKILEETGMVQRGHFIGKRTGLHFSTFVLKEALFAKPKKLKIVAEHLAACIEKNWPDAEVIVAPLTGGALLGTVVATEAKKQIDLVIADKRANSFSFRRVYAPKLHGKRVVLVDDLVRTGASLEQLVQAVQISGGVVIGAVVIANRCNPEILATKNGVPVRFLVDLKEDGYTEETIPSWLEAIPVNSTVGQPELTITLVGVTGKVGSGKSTVVKQLLEKLPSTERAATSDTLRNTLAILGLESTRENLLKLSKALRNSFGDEVTLRVLKKKIHSSDAHTVIIDGVRSMELVTLLRTYKKSLLVFVDSTEHTRYVRTVARTEKTDEQNLTMKEFSELNQKGFQKSLGEIRSKSDVIIENDGSYADLESAIDQLVTKIDNLG